MHDFNGYLLFALAFGVSVASPGPDVAALVARASSAGPRSAFGVLVGIVAGKLVLLTAALVGLAALVQALGPAFVAVKVTGALYLVHLGVRTWRRAGRESRTPASTGSSRLASDVALGLGMALANPIAIMFYVALLPSVVDVAAVGVREAGVLFAIVIGIMGAVGTGYVALANASRRLFASPRARRGLDKGSGAVLIGAGVAIAAR